jgi:integrase/recombinase XerD
MHLYHADNHSINLDLFHRVSRTCSNCKEPLKGPNEVRRKIAFTVKRLNDAMVKIMQWIGSTKNASPHKARHSFAQRAEEKEIHPKVLQKMYRHESVLTTMKYQSNFSFKKADDAIDAVLDF